MSPSLEKIESKFGNKVEKRKCEMEKFATNEPE